MKNQIDLSANHCSRRAFLASALALNAAATAEGLTVEDPNTHGAGKMLIWEVKCP